MLPRFGIELSHLPSSQSAAEKRFDQLLASTFEEHKLNLFPFIMEEKVFRKKVLGSWFRGGTILNALRFLHKYQATGMAFE